MPFVFVVYIFVQLGHPVMVRWTLIVRHSQVTRCAFAESNMVGEIEGLRVEQVSQHASSGYMCGWYVR